MSYLAIDPKRTLSATQIAKETHLSAPTVSKILKMLGEAGLLASTRGTGGGYTLARSADTITLAGIVTAIEGSVAMTECCMAENLCTLDSLCALKDNWKIINQMIMKALDGFTLKEMMQPLAKNSLSLKGIPIRVQ